MDHTFFRLGGVVNWIVNQLFFFFLFYLFILGGGFFCVWCLVRTHAQSSIYGYRQFETSPSTHSAYFLNYVRTRFRISLGPLLNFPEDIVGSYVQLLMHVGSLLSTEWYLKNDGPDGPIDEYIYVPLPIIIIP